jgi:Tfp pilus tip-associated adhesin PilY1
VRAVFRLAAALALTAFAGTLVADDKDLLVRTSSRSNLMIVFGNSQTTQQPIQGSTSAWDGDADSPASKMGAAKRVLAQFVADKVGQFNFGLTTFSHNPNAGSITIVRKHWLYAPLSTDFPAESWKEPAGTIERWGVLGGGPCTSLTVPSCTDRSPAFIALPAQATVVGPFFAALGAGSAFTYLDGNSSSATERIRITLTRGKYGDAFTNGTLSVATIPDVPAHSMEVTKEYQLKVSGSWVTQLLTPNGSPGTVVVPYAPPGTLPSDLFFRAGADAGKAIGFLGDAQNDFSVSSNCSGWEFQVNTAPLPLVKIPRDYLWGAACNAPQDSLPCLTRLMRPQAALVHYDQTSGAYSVTDSDNPGYAGSGSKSADGCDPNLRGAVDAGLDITENQAIVTTRNGSQAPIKNLLDNVYDYFSNSSIDGFQNGRRIDDPNKTCRNSAVVLIYDNFNACQNDSCSFLKSHVLTKLKQIGVPVYVVGLGSSATATSGTGVCIAQNTGAILPDGSVGYFPVTSSTGLYDALADIASFVNESSKDFAASTVSSVQAGGDQTVYLAAFNATKNRAVWNGRINAYALDASGSLQMGTKTISDPNDPDNGLTLAAPSNDPASLIWNAGENLVHTPGTGATDPSAILTPGAAMASGSYVDSSNDTVTSIPTHFYPGRKIVFALPQGYTTPVAALPIPAADSVPESRYDMKYDVSASWWSTLKALLGPQTLPPAVLSPALTDDDAGRSLRFIWGDRDAVISTTEANQRYLGLKLGDIFHSNPLIVGPPGTFAYFDRNLHGYQAFRSTYRKRRRVLFAGANDGLLHAFDVGVYGRDPSLCPALSGACFDLGTGTELFAFAPRAIMQIFKPLKDAAGPQAKRLEWTVDGAPAAADVFIDSSHSGTPVPADRAWHTILVMGMREGSNFVAQGGVSPLDTQGSYLALDITQPDELVDEGGGVVGPPAGAGTFLAPKCLNASGDASCGKDAADATARSNQPARPWPNILWEIVDTGDQDVAPSPGAGYRDMGETWSKPAIGRVKVCTGNCGSTSAPLPVTEDRYVAIFGGGFDRERLNRRGNWLYVVDIETGKALYRANSSCGVNAGAAGCSATYFGSIPSEPAGLDVNEDGYLDLVYVGDSRGRLWRVDLTDLRRLSSPASGRFDNQLDIVNGSGKPFLVFSAPQPVAPAMQPYYPIYFRPIAISLGFDSGAHPALGLAFGTGDRDDILSSKEPGSLNFKQRYYFVVDVSNTATRTEADLAAITSATAAKATSVPTKGWSLALVEGERLITDSLAIRGIIHFSTFNPLPATGTRDGCNNFGLCESPRGIARFYQVAYSTGDADVGADRGETQPNANFLTNPVLYTSQDGASHIIYTSDNEVKINLVPGGTRTSLKDWEENDRPR